MLARGGYIFIATDFTVDRDIDGPRTPALGRSASGRPHHQYYPSKTYV